MPVLVSVDPRPLECYSTTGEFSLAVLVAKEVKMKRFLMMTLVCVITAVFVSAVALLVPAAPPAKQMAVVDITDKTKLLKAELLGKYIFIHDDEKLARGEPCFYVYRFSQDQN